MKIKKAMGYVATIGCAALIIAAALMAEEPAVTSRVATRFDAAYFNKYVWRGAVLNADPVVQPSLTFTLADGLSYNLWMTANTRTNTVAGKSNLVVENDHTLNYAFPAGRLGLNVGYVYYAFPNTSAHSTSECYGIACLGGKLSPTLSVNCDVDEIRGAYIALSTSCTCPLPISKSSSTVAFSGKLGLGTGGYVSRAYPGTPDKVALLDLVLSAASTISLSAHYSVTPAVSYSSILDCRVRNVLSQPDNLVVGLTVTSAF